MSHPQPPQGQPDDPWQTTRHLPQHGPGQPAPSYPVTPPQGGGWRNNRTLIAVIAGAAVVLVIGCCTGLYIIGSQEQQNRQQPSATESLSETRSPTSQPTTAVTTAAPTAAPTRATPTAPAVKTVKMPKVVGENAAIADDKLRKLGFTNVRYGSQDEADKVVLLLTNWTVTKQSTKAGAKVGTDTLIVLTCTKEG